MIAPPWGKRPKLGRFTLLEMQAFRADFPYRVAFDTLHAPEGTDRERKLIEAFFRQIGSPVATTGNAVYLATETDVTLLKLGMYR